MNDIFRERSHARNMPALQRAFFSTFGTRNAMFTRELRTSYLSPGASQNDVRQPANTWDTRVREDRGGQIPFDD